MNNKEHHQSESGQALVLIVLGFVVLLGFTALAIDGSMLYSDRRYAQNAADASSLAGGGQAALSMENSHVTKGMSNFCASSQISSAASVARSSAIQRAADNGFIIDADPSDDGISDDGSVKVICDQVNVGGFTKKYLDVIVNTVIDTQTSFAHFVYRGPMRNRVKAVTRVYPRQPVAQGQAIVALNPNSCQGNQDGAGFWGTSGVEVFGSGVFTNGCLQGNGGPEVTAEGDIFWVEEFIEDGTFSPAPQQTTDRLNSEDFGIDSPDCGDPGAHIWGASVFRNQSSLAAGLHCVYPDHQSAVAFNNGSLEGIGVTIVLVDVELTINGNVEVDLYAPLQGSNPSPAVEGLLLYAIDTNCDVNANLDDIALSGNGDSVYEGTIYAPCHNVSLLGTADMEAFRSQVIAYNVEVGGTAGSVVHYDPNDTYSKPTWIHLQE
jgi:hypothetical protein